MLRFLALPRARLRSPLEHRARLRDVVVRELLAAEGDPRRTASRVASVGVSGIGPCALPATEDGEPLRPAILYGVDTRAVEEIDELTAKLREATVP